MFCKVTANPLLERLWDLGVKETPTCARVSEHEVPADESTSCQPLGNLQCAPVHTSECASWAVYQQLKLGCQPWRFACTGNSSWGTWAGRASHLVSWMNTVRHCRHSHCISGYIFHQYLHPDQQLMETALCYWCLSQVLCVCVNFSGRYVSFYVCPIGTYLALLLTRLSEGRGATAGSSLPDCLVQQPLTSSALPRRFEWCVNTVKSRFPSFPIYIFWITTDASACASNTPK